MDIDAQLRAEESVTVAIVVPPVAPIYRTVKTEITMKADLIFADIWRDNFSKVLLILC